MTFGFGARGHTTDYYIITQGWLPDAYSPMGGVSRVCFFWLPVGFVGNAILPIWFLQLLCSGGLFAANPNFIRYEVFAGLACA